MARVAVCTENLIRIDCVTESPNVNGDDRALLPLPDLVRLAVQAKSRLEAENAALRHQLIVLQRRVRGRVQLTNGDRLFLVLLYRWFPSLLRAITIIRPETGALASGRLSPLLALEVPLLRRPAPNRRRLARAGRAPVEYHNERTAP